MSRNSMDLEPGSPGFKSWPQGLRGIWNELPLQMVCPAAPFPAEGSQPQTCWLHLTGFLSSMRPQEPVAGGDPVPAAGGHRRCHRAEAAPGREAAGGRAEAGEPPHPMAAQVFYPGGNAATRPRALVRSGGQTQQFG